MVTVSERPTEVQKKTDATRREISRRQLLPFTKYTKRNYRVQWYHRLICETLDDWISGKIKRLMVFAPPRHGKSELVSRRLPSLILGMYPNAKIISASYNMNLAEDMNNDVQKIIDSERYRLLFPKTTLAGQSAQRFKLGGKFTRTSKQFQIVGHEGAYVSAGVGTGITGKGFDFGIIDDPVKNRQEAESETVRNTVWDWYMSTFESRQEGEVPILVTVTRWHEDDLAGRLLAAQEKGGEHALKWRIIRLPALAEPEENLDPMDVREGEGEALWPGKFSRKVLLGRRATLTGYEWDSLYQQRPLPPGGGKIKRKWFKMRDTIPEGLSWKRFWDLAVSAKKSADYTASIAAALDAEGNIYLRDMVRGQWEWPDVKRNIIATALTEKIPICVEEGGQQIGFISQLLEEPELQGISVTGSRPDKDKLTRALPWIARAEAGKIYLINGSWINEFLNECQHFTGISDKHDDQIDAVSGVYLLIAQVKAADCGIDASPEDYMGEHESVWGNSNSLF